MTRCVIFDLDGTLADTSGDLIAAANHCFAAMGAATRLNPVADAGTALRGGKAMLTLGLTREGQYSAELVERWYPELLLAYRRALDLHTRLYAGAMDAVEALRADGVAVGICTNKPEALAEDLLQKLGVRGAFASLIGADTLSTRKPDPAPYVASVEQAGGSVARSCLIGDTETDRKTALAVGVPCVLVTFGPGPSVHDLNPDATIDHFYELPALVGRILT
ncbi:HAD-IA family hydrolase [Mesobacterium sp. TK19101]|uniref:phosphoglycolate phosphatase n=1 Tax=Mesobacterium hydrothermale TaxID=3111907 RepID=A0ABU6HMP9_9RHOB|nr:HAD-IA family hydrolase [Mesobacterium sp. TK19101]MEC3863199.1 HAD-IA family hydrolase [Mesobacterium sp. TK19101]